MNVFHGTLTSKGQTTIPAEVRERLNLKAGDKIRYIVDGDNVVMKAKNLRAVDLIGILHDPDRPTATVEDFDEAIGAYLGEKYGRDGDDHAGDDRDGHERPSESDAG